MCFEAKNSFSVILLSMNMPIGTFTNYDGLLKPSKQNILSISKKFLNLILSQPNNNHNPNNKTTITVVGLRQSKRWEHHHPPPQTQNYMIEQK